MPSLYLKTHKHSSSSLGYTPFRMDYKVIHHVINIVFPLCSPVNVLWILSLSSIKHSVTQIILLFNCCCFRCLGYTFDLLFPYPSTDSHLDLQTWAHPCGSSESKFFNSTSPGCTSCQLEPIDVNYQSIPYLFFMNFIIPCCNQVIDCWTCLLLC